MTQKELDIINKSFKAWGVQLSFLKPVKDKGIELSVEHITITEWNAIPVDYFLRESVKNAVMQEILVDVFEGKPIPSGVNLIGGESSNEQTKGPNRKSKSLSKPGRARGPRASVKTTRSKPNSSRKNTVSGADAKGSKVKRPEEKGVGENKE